jgi:hypothetical protein
VPPEPIYKILHLKMVVKTLVGRFEVLCPFHRIAWADFDESRLVGKVI